MTVLRKSRHELREWLSVVERPRAVMVALRRRLLPARRPRRRVDTRAIMRVIRDALIVYYIYL